MNSLSGQQKDIEIKSVILRNDHEITTKPGNNSNPTYVKTSCDQENDIEIT